MRVWLNQAWSAAKVLRYISPNITSVDVAIMAAKRM
jgi:hypothetical protein